MKKPHLASILLMMLVFGNVVWIDYSRRLRNRLKDEAMGNLDFSATICAQAVSLIRLGKPEEAANRLETAINVFLVASDANEDRRKSEEHRNALRYVKLHRARHGHLHAPEAGTREASDHAKVAEMLKHVPDK